MSASGQVRKEPGAQVRRLGPLVPWFLALFFALGPAHAATNLNIQGVNRVEFWAFKTDWQTSIDDKLDLNLKYGDLNGNLGLLAFEPSRPWVGTRQPLRLFDYTVAYSPKRFEILYGKYFQTFGKGLALRTYTDDDFRHYKSLHGLRGIARLPLRTDVVLLGGRLRDVFFQENTYKVLNRADTGDQVLGADITTRAVKHLALGGRYVRINRSTDLSAKAFTELIGGNGKLSYGPAELYGELCQRLGTKPGVGGREKGLGYYLDGLLTLGSYSVLAEYMDYDKLAVPRTIGAGNLGPYHYNDPPTPIKSGVGIESRRGSDERGYSLVLTGTPVAPLYLEADFGRLFSHDDSSAGVIEWEGKSRYSAGGSWTLEAKLNHMYQKNIELHVLERTVDKPVFHVNWLGGQHTVAFEAEYAFVSEQTDESLPPGPWKYHETALSLSYGYGAGLLFTLGWQGVDMKLARRYNSEKSWPMFETVWSITDRNVLRVRIGAERGGYTCSGGVCRFETPFTGAKLQLISRF